MWLHREDEDGVDGGGGGSGGDECDNDGEGEGKGEEEEVMVVVVVAVCMSEVGMCYGAISNLGAAGAAGKDGRTTQLVPTCLAVLMLLGMYGWKRYDWAFITRLFLSGCAGWCV